MDLESMKAMLAKSTDPQHREFWERQIAYEQALRDSPPPKCPACGDFIAPDGFCTSCLLRDYREGKL